MENGMTKILELIKKEAHSLFIFSKHGKTHSQNHWLRNDKISRLDSVPTLLNFNMAPLYLNISIKSHNLII